MARVDFYVLKQSGEQARRLFACRLAEKAYKLDNSVHIQAASRNEAQTLDELLWTFRDGSFVPHGVIDSGTQADSPVTIGYDTDTAPERDVLINLCDDVPSLAASFPRVAELVTSDDDAKQKSRKRFATYRDQGHSIETHKL